MENKKLYKAERNKKICGVCGGIGEYLNVDPTVIRLLWVISFFFFGTGLLVYIICLLYTSDAADELTLV